MGGWVHESVQQIPVWGSIAWLRSWSAQNGTTNGRLHNSAWHKIVSILHRTVRSVAQDKSASRGAILSVSHKASPAMLALFSWAIAVIRETEAVIYSDRLVVPVCQSVLPRPAVLTIPYIPGVLDKTVRNKSLKLAIGCSSWGRKWRDQACGHESRWRQTRSAAPDRRDAVWMHRKRTASSSGCGKSAVRRARRPPRPRLQCRSGQQGFDAAGTEGRGGFRVPKPNAQHPGEIMRCRGK
ncbi:hypothetical protein DFH06DRAFT_97754 [Mycena polygramma]|nr:hypothetical protein DFH06DRAFT_97754 [Mycena polygramma]